MNRFLAYFDYLGYKEFVLNNSPEVLTQRSGNILRDIEMALGLNKFKEDAGRGLIADLADSRINCINISDTVILVTKENTLDNLIELLKVSKRLNNSGVFRTMPLRGAIHFGEFNMRIGQQENEHGVVYSANLMYGKVLVEAHLKAESQNWAGTVIDLSVTERITKETDLHHFLEFYAKLYCVPYKISEIETGEEYVLKFTEEPINEEAFKNLSRNIIASFSSDNKNINSPGAQEKLKNTLQFLESHKISQSKVPTK